LLESFGQGLGVFAIAFLGGVAGALAKHVLGFVAKRIDQRMATRAVLGDLVIETLSEIRELSVKYWASDESPELKPVAARIVAMLENVSDLYVQLFDGDTKVTMQLDVKLNRLSNAITGGSFQGASRTADHAVIADMEAQMHALIVHIRLEKAKLRYPWY
jgi:hypothetical protein